MTCGGFLKRKVDRDDPRISFFVRFYQFLIPVADFIWSTACFIIARCVNNDLVIIFVAKLT